MTRRTKKKIKERNKKKTIEPTKKNHIQKHFNNVDFFSL